MKVIIPQLFPKHSLFPAPKGESTIREARSELSFDQVSAALLSKEWKFAKTMAYMPHWYSLREKWEDQKLFEDIVLYIREKGYKRHFYKKIYTYLQINEFEYWTMGDPLSSTTLINRAKIKERIEEYDIAVEKYDTLFNDPESRMEDRYIFSLLPFSGRVLDIGCGTGLLLENSIPPENYLGIDPSIKMLQKLVEKYPEYREAVYPCPFERFYFKGGFNLIASLFGSISYVQAEDIKRISFFLSPGGKHFLMFYKNGYSPICHTLTGIKKQFFYYQGQLPGSTITEYHNFEIVTNL